MDIDGVVQFVLRLGMWFSIACIVIGAIIYGIRTGLSDDPPKDPKGFLEDDK